MATAPAPVPAVPARPGLAAVLPFAATIFASAFLLFQVQPMIGKWILPWFGGSPAVWTTAMLFFQTVLFGGYLYAHLLATRPSPRVQATVHLALLAAAAAAAAQVLPDASMKPDGEDAPVARILWILAASVGLPYFCLATTGPLVQHWYARSGAGGSAFRLYALSNVGSFLALLSFPYLLEPRFALPEIGRGWTLGFWAFAIACAAVTLRAAVAPGSAVPDRVEADATAARPARVPWRVRAGWIALPALASLAFVATTDHVSHDVAPEPRVWIATLALYLATFVLAFDHPRWYRPAWTALVALGAIALLSGRDVVPGWFGFEPSYDVADLRALHYLAMFAICLACHGELHRRRPADTRRLTEFYLWMSAGGAAGGLFVALVATHLFDDYHEWPLMLVASIGLACAVLARELGGSGADARAALRARLLPGWPRTSAAVALAGFVAVSGAVLHWEDPLRLRSLAGDGWTAVRLAQTRNFYGTVTVDERRHASDPSRDVRVFYSGQITHGLQYLAADRRDRPLTYYSEESGIGETLRWVAQRQPSARVALVGLGAGTLATYARESDAYDFYEINPDAVRIATTHFDYVPRCRARETRMLVGDARLVMERLRDGTRYDVIVLDAFTGGSVPVHLLTREAFATYARLLAPDGFIAINITNGWLNLYPVVKAQAEALGFGYRNRWLAADPARAIRQNQHFVMTRDAAYLERFPSVNRQWRDDGGAVVRTESLDVPGVPLWTDAFSSLTPIAWK